MFAAVAALWFADASQTRGIVDDPCAAAVALKSADQRPSDFGGLCRYFDNDRRLIASGAHIRAVMFGDSITEGWLANDPVLFRDGVIDRGITGQTTAQMLVRFQQDVIDLKPSAVHIMGGTNDIAANNDQTAVDEAVSNIQSMAELARAHRIRVIIGSVLPVSRFHGAPERRPAPLIAELNRRLAAFARAERFQFVDYYSVLANREGGMDPVNSGDGVHPSRDGYARMHSLAARAIAQVR